jgi:hypothetical protein
MATRSTIAMEMKDGTVKSIYCHWDGYPEHNGRILMEFYSNPDKVKDLIELGRLSSLAPALEPDGPHSFNSPVSGVVVAYHRDREEDLVIEEHSSVSDFFNSSFPTSYRYLFTQEGEWLCQSAHAGHKTPVVINSILSGEIKL